MSTLELPSGFKRFIDSENGSCFVELVDGQPPLRLEVYVKTDLTLEMKEVRIGVCDDQYVWCEIIPGYQGEMKALSFEEMEQINTTYGGIAIPFP